MPTEDSTPQSADPPAATRAAPPGLILRAREPGDWQALAALMQLPRVPWGTLRLPFVSAEETRKWVEKPPEGLTCIVAILDDRLVGVADVTRYRGRRDHVGGIGMSVHDDFHGRGIGAARRAGRYGRQVAQPAPAGACRLCRQRARDTPLQAVRLRDRGHAARRR